MRRPHYIADQARNARGPVGWFVATIMARETRRPNTRAIDALGIVLGDRVLDIGCGPGGSLAALAERAGHGHVAGADPSDLMVKIATRRNRTLIKAGRVVVIKATAALLPFDDGAFDKVLCVHVLYFWNDLRENLQEIARVLRPGGQLALLFRSTNDQSAVSNFPSDVYRFRSVMEVCTALAAEGFEVSSPESQRAATDSGPSPHLILATRLDSQRLPPPLGRR